MEKKTIILFTLILTLSMCTSGFSQNRSKNSKEKFKVCITSIKRNQNPQIRYNSAMDFFANEWSTTLQLQDVCYYLPNDELKYELCKTAYPRIIDKNNFFEIYNSFSKFSFAIKLYHNTQSKDNSLDANDQEESSPERYSDDDCHTEHDRFDNIIKAIKDKTFAAKQMEAAKRYIAKNCFSMPQLRQIVSILIMDDDKLELIKYLYNYAPIPEKVYTFKSALTFSSSKDELDQFLLERE